MKNYKSIVESILFVWGEPVNINKISKTLELSKVETRKVLDEMVEEYKENQRGIQIIEINNSFQFSTRKENYQYIEEFCAKSSSKGLSNSTLEVLAIIAYKQPITKMDIESIRGVSSDGPVSNLVMRELVEEKGRLEKIGRPIIYGTTDVFLKSFGFKDIKELPDISEFTKFYEHKVE